MRNALGFLNRAHYLPPKGFPHVHLHKLRFMSWVYRGLANWRYDFDRQELPERVTLGVMKVI